MTTQSSSDRKLSIEVLLEIFIHRIDVLKREELQQVMLFMGFDSDRISTLLKRCERLLLLERSIQNSVSYGLDKFLTKAGTNEHTAEHKLAKRFFLYELREVQNRSIADVSKVIWLGRKGAGIAGVRYLKYSFEELNASLRLSQAYMSFIETGNQPQSWHRLVNAYRFDHLARVAIAKVGTEGRLKYVVAPIFSPKFSRGQFNRACRSLECDYEIC
ncbi:MAG: hypothetical protein SGI77_04435 [Pirellulaceae bacterium]|nr:hypothetical protein [Pirellulaceae bacterium]